MNEETFKVAQALKHFGNVCFENGEIKAAFERYSESLKQFPPSALIGTLLTGQQQEYARVRGNRAECLFRLREHEQAVEECTWALTADPSYDKAYFRRARSFVKLGKTESAKADLEVLIANNPENQDVRRLLRSLSHPAEAISRKQSIKKETIQSKGPTLGLLPDSAFPTLLRNGYIQVMPEGSDQPPANILFILHGVGDTPKPYAELAKRMQLPNTLAVALAGPVEIAETDGGRAWFRMFDDEWNLIEPSRMEQRRICSLAVSCQLLCQLIDGLIDNHGWSPERIHLLGFSNGGTVVLELAQRYRGKRALGGAVAVSASILPEQLQGASGGPVSQSPPTDVLITHGDKDQVVLRRHVMATVSLLQKSHPQANVTLRTFRNKKHDMIGSEEEMREVMKFWDKKLLAPKPQFEDHEEVIEVNNENVQRSEPPALDHTCRSGGVLSGSSISPDQ
mmetsp:Transcript_14044/g.23761  ORF Transcript_14044/g.23761 Transcript_14044/m.23761 type:complete len:452 (+) Transcript_14044:336-1691(+)